MKYFDSHLLIEESVNQHVGLLTASSRLISEHRLQLVVRRLISLIYRLFSLFYFCLTSVMITDAAV